MTCLSHLRQVGQATLQFHDARGAFPPARIQPKMRAYAPYDCGGQHPSWLVRILPFLEYTSEYANWDLSKPYSEHPAEVIEGVVPVYSCPSRRAGSDAVVASKAIETWVQLPCGCGALRTISMEGGAVGDYAGNHGDLSPGAVGAETDFYWGGNGTGVIISSRGLCESDRPVDWVDRIRIADLTDGTSQTILAGELHVTPDRKNQQPYNGPIYNGEDLAASARVGGPGVPIARSARESQGSVLGFGSWHPDVCHFVLADGSARGVHNFMDTVTLGHLCRRDDGAVNCP